MWKHRLKKDLNNYIPLKSVKNMSVLSLFSFKMDEKLKLNALLQKTISFHIPASNTESTLTQQIILAQNLHPESEMQKGHITALKPRRGLFLTSHIQTALPTMNAVFTHQLY